MPVTILLKALGCAPNRFSICSSIPTVFVLGSSGLQLELAPERLKGEAARFVHIVTEDGKTLVQKDKRITAKVIRDIQAAGIKLIDVPVDTLYGRLLAHDVINPDTGEVIARANEEITEELAITLDKSGVTDFVLYVNDLDQGPWISSTLRSDETVDRWTARVAIYRMMRCPGEPPTEDAVQVCSGGPLLLRRPVRSV